LVYDFSKACLSFLFSSPRFPLTAPDAPRFLLFYLSLCCCSLPLFLDVSSPAPFSSTTAPRRSSLMSRRPASPFPDRCRGGQSVQPLLCCKIPSGLFKLYTFLFEFLFFPGAGPSCLPISASTRAVKFEAPAFPPRQSTG